MEAEGAVQDKWWEGSAKPYGTYNPRNQHWAACTDFPYPPHACRWSEAQAATGTVSRRGGGGWHPSIRVYWRGAGRDRQHAVRVHRDSARSR